MRRFEIRESGHFWEVEQSGQGVTIRWGTVGASVQTQVESYSTSNEAGAAAEKLIAEKVGEGYSEVSTATSEAERLWREGEAKSETGLLDRALQLDRRETPGYVTGWAVRAAAFFRQGQLQGARVCWERATQQNPEDLNSWLNLGCVHLREGNPRAAIDPFKAATALSPQDERGWGYLANALTLTGRSQEVWDLLGKLSPSPFATLLRGRAALGLQRWDEAVEALGSLPPETPQATEWLTEALRGRGQPEDLRRLCQLCPEDPAAWCKLGQRLSGDEALSAFNRSLAYGYSAEAVRGRVGALQERGRGFEVLLTQALYQVYDPEFEKAVLPGLQAWLEAHWNRMVPAATPEVAAAARFLTPRSIKLKVGGESTRFTALDWEGTAWTNYVLECDSQDSQLKVKLRLTSSSIEVLEVVDLAEEARRRQAESELRQAALRGRFPALARPQAVTSGPVQYLPQLRRGSDHPAGERFGGQPWGLPLEKWPICKCCGRAQSFIVQLEHHRERLDLGAQGRRLYVFQCQAEPGDCESWEPFSGASAVVIVDAADQTAGLTVHPKRPQIETEMQILNWVPTADLGKNKEAALEALDRGEHYKIQGTRLGGSPCWVQGPESPEGYRFAGQFSYRHDLWDEPQHFTEQGADWTHIMGPGYGDCGTAYLFLKDGAGVFFWQCH